MWFRNVVMVMTFASICQCSFSAAFDSLQLINKDGTCRTSNQISKHFSSGELPDSRVNSLVSVIDCSGANKGFSLVNSIFGTGFSSLETGVSMAVSDGAVVLYSSFDCMVSSKFCGCNAIDYCNTLPGSTCLIFKSSDISSSLVGYDQIFRRVLKHSKQSSAAYEVTILLDMSGKEDTNEVEDRITSHVKAIWDEMDMETDFEQAVSLHFTSVTGDDASQLMNAKSAVLDSSNRMKEASLDSTLMNSLVEFWNSVNPAGEPRLLLSPAQREAIYKIEEAYASGLAHADVTIGQWQQRVSSGNVIGKFAKRVGQLILSVKEEFDAKTASSSISEFSPVRERIDRLQSLRNHIDTAVLTLYRQQLSTLESKVTSTFKKQLLSSVAGSSLDEGTEEEQEEEANKEKQILRKSLFDFKSMAADLESDSSMPSSLSSTLEMETTSKLSELSGVLEAMAKEFPETAAAKLEEIKKIDKMAKQSGPQRPQKKGRRIPKISNFALNIVGMLRPPGFGNLQGFVGYATQLAGLCPLELLLGVQNDGDSPEVMGEDREYPILRLQPKVNFDIDL